MNLRTAKQNKEIWSLVGRLGKEIGENQGDDQSAEERMREMVEKHSGQRSTRLLTPLEAARVICDLEIEIEWGTLRDMKDPQGEPTGPQLWVIKRLFKELGMDTPERRKGFCRRVICKPWPTDRTEANKIYEGLKAMWMRRFKHKAFDMILELEACGTLTDWEWEFLQDAKRQIEKRETLKSAGTLHKLLEIYGKRSHEKILSA